jgi:hypothetical protein
MLRVLVVLAVAARLAHADCPHAAKQLAVAHGTPKIDGLLDDAVWATACFADDFEQKTPNYGAKPTHPIRVAIALDADTLYIAARMWSAGPTDVEDAVTARDDTDQAERFIVSLDPSHTRRIAYSFAVTAAGVRADWIHTDDSEGNRDYSWNPVWITKTAILADGWSLEMAIPLSQVRLPREPATSWGINFDWYLPRRNEDVFWRAVPKDRQAWASYFGELVELPPVHPGVNLELLPYVAVRGTVDESAPAPPAHRLLAGLEAGLDAKLRPLPGFVINATINPDFGQVEADPAFVNLTAFEVTLPEKRPFFVENNSLLVISEANYFYSRRIGGLPVRLPDYDAIELSQPVRILGAVEAAGYVEAKTQVAALAAVTDQTSADAIVAGRREQLVVSPLSLFTAGRVQHQIAASWIGASATFVDRSLAGTGLDALLDERAFFGQADADFRTDDGEWELYPWAGISGVFGSAAAITTIEETSAHYFQRPDQTYLHLDTTAHGLTGWDAGLYGGKRSGMYQGSLSISVISPGFELNDLGVLRQADAIDLQGELIRNVTTPTEHLYAWSSQLDVDQAIMFDGTRKPLFLNETVRATAPNLWSAAVTGNFGTPGVYPDTTRGGPDMHTDYQALAALNISSPYGRSNQINATVQVQQSRTQDRGLQVNVVAATRVAPALRLDLIPSLTLIENQRQYVATVTDEGGGDGTYGARYIFGHIHRHELALQLRATLALSPDLVITVFAQPFLSSGRYDQIGELISGATGDVRWYDTAVHDGTSRTIADGTHTFSVAEPDYTVASLRSTAVLRWEFRPGSTLYIAWQQDRGGIPTTVATPLHSTIGDAFTHSAIHTLAMKLSWWFG